MPRNKLIQFRQGTETEWNDVDPVLASGEVGFATDQNKIKIGDGVSLWSELSYMTGGSGGGAVDSVAGRTGTVVLTKSDVSLANVDDTSDSNKPVSTATQTALNDKANLSHNHEISDITGLQTALDGKQDAGSNNSYFPQGW